MGKSNYIWTILIRFGKDYILKNIWFLTAMSQIFPSKSNLLFVLNLLTAKFILYQNVMFLMTSLMLDGSSCFKICY